MHTHNTDRDALRKSLLHKVVDHVPGRTLHVPDKACWGELIEPAPGETPAKTPQGVKVVAICSWTLGFLAFETLKLMERRLPEKVNITGLVTDDPVDRHARISKKKRFWRYYSKTEQAEYERGILEAALTFGVPCYTGEVKCDYFRGLLARWNPDVIIVAAFGQRIDRPIIDYPCFGIYNVHPADLLHHHGAGPQPWEELLERQAQTTRVAIHQVSEEIDTGSVVGESPPINVRMRDGTLSDDVRMIGEKTLVPVDHMVAWLMVDILGLKATGNTGPINYIDFERLFPDSLKKKLMEPIDPSQRGHILPLPSEDIMFTV